MLSEWVPVGFAAKYGSWHPDGAIKFDMEGTGRGAKKGVRFVMTCRYNQHTVEGRFVLNQANKIKGKYIAVQCEMWRKLGHKVWPADLRFDIKPSVGVRASTH